MFQLEWVLYLPVLYWCCVPARLSVLPVRVCDIAASECSAIVCVVSTRSQVVPHYELRALRAAHCLLG